MNNLYTNTFSTINVRKNMSPRSEVITQIIYGDSFLVLKNNKNWWKIKIQEDGYIGFIKKKNFLKYIKPTHKVNIISANIYREKNLSKIIGSIPFGSKIRAKKVNSRFIKFEKKLIKIKDVQSIDSKNTDIFSKIKMFKGKKYKWGGKTYKGIDCSALVQIFFNFNNKFCPRDAKDQIKFFKKNIKLDKIKKNDIIYWKGHVAVALSKDKLIHAYGPMKKTVIMNIKKTIKIIKKTARLEVLSIKRP